MLTLKYNNLTILICVLFCLQNVQSDLQNSTEDIEYALTRISNRQRAVHLKSPAYFGHESQFNLQSLIEGKKKQKQQGHDVGDMPQNAAHNEEIFSGNKITTKKVEENAATSTLSQQLKVKSKQGELEKWEPQDQQLEEKEVEAKPIIQNGANQPHNQQNQQHLTVNQVKMKQQLLSPPPPHHFKLLNVVNHRNKRQTHAGNYNNNNNSGNQQQQQQQYSTITIHYYPQQQQQQQQQEQTPVQYQLQEQQPQQYQLQYYQTNQSPNQQQQQQQQNYNNIELIVNGNSLSTFPQSRTELTAAMTIPIPISLPIVTSTPKPLQGFTTTFINPSPPLTSSLSSATLSTEKTSFNPLLPLEVIKEVNDDKTTLPPATVCKVCCITNEFPCSSCCDSTPLLNAQTLKTLGG